MAWPCARAQCGSGEPRIVMWVALWDARVSGRAMSAREVALDARDAGRSVAAAGSVLFVSLSARMHLLLCTSLHFP